MRKITFKTMHINGKKNKEVALCETNVILFHELILYKIWQQKAPVIVYVMFWNGVFSMFVGILHLTAHQQTRHCFLECITAYHSSAKSSKSMKSIFFYFRILPFFQSGNNFRRHFSFEERCVSNKPATAARCFHISLFSHAAGFSLALAVCWHRIFYIVYF